MSLMLHHRLFLQIYLAFLAITAFCLVAAGVAAHLHFGGPPPMQDGPPHIGGLLIIAAIIAAGTYPLARRLARRLERLRRGVDELGAGDLGARVPDHGHDEVAALARSFNQAADRIEALVTSQRSMLASASHELRSPLARLRLSVELMGEAGAGEARQAHRAEAVRDIEELDQLVEDLLLVGRLELREQVERRPVDLLGLAAEEAARVGAEVGGEQVQVLGDEALLRILLRNLLENATRHGEAPVTVEIEAVEGAVKVTVADAGPGVPQDQRERIFEPFYRPAERPEGDGGGGTGLGLALVRRVSRLHGGEVRCEGSRFVVEVPQLPSSGAPAE